MRILVCEFVTGGGLRDHDPPAALVREGDMMLWALVKDLVALPGHEIWTTRDDRLPDAQAGAYVQKVRVGQSVWSTLGQLLPSVDVFWPIAPECDGALERLCALARRIGCRVIASDPQSLAISASKLATSDNLTRHGLPAVTTWRTNQIGKSPTGWVAKPDNGAGCEETHYFKERRTLEDWLSQLATDRRFVVQPYVQGEPVSLSFLCRDGNMWLMSCNRQRISLRGGRIHYDGSDVSAFETKRGRFEPLAEAIAKAMPGLWGYIGADVIDTPQGPKVLEINPRLTTSYVALGRSIGINPAEQVLALLDNGIETIRCPLNATPCIVETADA